MSNLTDLGVNIGMIIAGFFGSLLMVGKTSAFNIRTTITSIVAGVASSNYLTPIIVDTLGMTNQHVTYSISFILGFLGLRGVELIASKMTKTIKTEKNDNISIS